MPIQYRPEGEAALVAKLSVLGAQREKAEREAAQAREMQAVAMRVESDQQARQFEAKRQLEDRLMDQQFADAAKKQAFKWELQKLQIRSQDDFALAEKEHQMKVEYDIQKQLRRKSEYDRLIEELNGEKGKKMYTPEQRTRVAQKLWESYADINMPVTKLDDVLGQYLSQMAGKGAGGTQGTTQGGIVPPGASQGPSQGMIRVVSPTGQPGTIPADKWPAAQTAGYKRVG